MHSCQGICMALVDAENVDINDNVFYNASRHHIYVDFSLAIVEINRNLMVKVV